MNKKFVLFNGVFLAFVLLAIGITEATKENLKWQIQRSHEQDGLLKVRILMSGLLIWKIP